MPRRYRRRPTPRLQRYYDDDYSYSPRRRRGCLAPIRRFFQNVVTAFLIVVGTLVFFCVVLLIAFNFMTFTTVLIYALYVVAGFAILGALYAVVRIIAAISHRISAASIARSQARMQRERARIEKERVRQEKQKFQLQQVKLAREEYTFSQKPDSYQGPRRTRTLRDDPSPAQATQIQSPYRTRNLREVNQEPLVRSLPALSHPPQQVQGPLKIPHIPQLIGTKIVADQKDMLYGFEMINGLLTAVRNDWPGTAIIAGKSGSGKTRRVMIMLFQAILARQHVTVCDPHAYKPDGLINVLAPFAPWLRFARTNAEIVAAAKEHIVEFESRLTPSGSVNGEGLQPRLIIFDEFPALMKSDSISKEEKRLITKCVRESATQYRGLFGTAWIIGQEFTEDAIGDTAIRKDAHAVLCHQLSDEYVRFLFPRDLKTQRLIQQIARRECVYKDADNQIKRIFTPTILDDEIPAMVAYLRHVMPSQGTSQPTTRLATPLQSRSTEPIAPRVYGAPARRNSVTPPQKRVLYQTSRVEHHQASVAAPKEPRSQPSTMPQGPGATTWGEDMHIPAPLQLPQPRSVAPMTEDLQRSPAQPSTTRQTHQDDLDLLAERRKKKKETF